MSNFELALQFTLEAEGGYSNVSGDRGGKTMHGITQATYDTWRVEKGLSTQAVKLIADDEVRAIYQTYWDAAQCSQMPARIAVQVFDWAVNSGAKRAIVGLQSCIKVKPDGAWGPASQYALNAAVASQNLSQLCDAYLAARRQFFTAIARGRKQQQFAAGWMTRVNKLERYIETIP